MLAKNYKIAQVGFHLLIFVLDVTADGSSTRSKSADFSSCFGPLDSHYTGRVNVTADGDECQRWDFRIRSFDEDQKLIENYCRNPNLNDLSPGTWCYPVGGAEPKPCKVSECTGLAKVSSVSCESHKYTVIVRWQSAPGYKEGYIIECPKEIGHVEVTSRKFTCFNLTPGNRYNVRISTVHTHFYPVHVSVSCKTEISAVKSGRIIHKTPTSLTAEWLHTEGDKDYYQLDCLSYDNALPVTNGRILVVPTKSRSGTCSGLVPGIQYFVRICSKKTGFLSPKKYIIMDNSTKTSLEIAKNVTVDESTISSMTVQWEPAGGYKDFYEVQCIPNDTSRINVTVVVNSSSETATCTGLSPNSWYIVTVVTKRAEWPDAETVGVMSALGDPNAKPSNFWKITGISVLQRTTKSLLVGWNHDNYNEVLWYIVTCTPCLSASVNVTLSRVNVSSNKGMCHELTPGTQYSVSVEVSGWPKIATVALRNDSTKTKLDRPRNITVILQTPSLLNFNWTHAEGDKEYYSVNCVSDEQGALSSRQTVNSSANFASCSGLTAGTWYSVKIFTKKDGWNDSSESFVKDETSKTKLDCPRNITVILQTQSLLSFNWTHAEGGKDYYSVNCVPGEQIARSSRQIVNSSANFASCGGLTAGVWYSVKISTKKDGWKDSWNFVKDEMTKTKLAVVRDVGAMSQTYSSLSVTWTHARGKKDVYLISCISVRSGRVASTAVVNNISNHGICAGLEPASWYFVSVTTKKAGWTEVSSALKKYNGTKTACAILEGIRLCPRVFVVCLTNCPIDQTSHIRPGKLLKLRAVCVNCKFYKYVTYNWKIETSVRDDIDVPNIEADSTLTEGKVLEIESQILTPNTKYTFKVGMRINDMSISADYEVEVKKFQFEADGCIILVDVPRISLVNFTVTCPNVIFEVPDLTYEYMARCGNRTQVILGRTDAPEYAGIFPYFKDCKNILTVIVIDKFGARHGTDIEFPRVSIQDPRDPRSSMESLEGLLQSLQNTGHIGQALALIEFSSFTSTEASEREKLLKMLTTLRVSAERVKQAISTMMKVTSMTGVVSAEPSIAAAKTLTNYLNMLRNDLVQNQSRSQSTEVLKEATQTASNIFANALGNRSTNGEELNIWRRKSLTKELVGVLNSIADATLEVMNFGEKPTLIAYDRVSVLAEFTAANDLKRFLPFKGGILDTGRVNMFLRQHHGHNLTVMCKVLGFIDNPYFWSRNIAVIATGIMSLEYQDKFKNDILTTKRDNGISIGLKFSINRSQKGEFVHLNYSIPSACESLKRRLYFDFIQSQTLLQGKGAALIRFANGHDINATIWAIAKEASTNITGKDFEDLRGKRLFVISRQSNWSFLLENNKKNVISAAVGLEINKRDKRCRSNIAKNIKLVLEIKQYACLYWQTQAAVWNTSGCWLSRRPTKDSLYCQCNHLSTYAGGLLRLPNTLHVERAVELLESVDTNYIVLTAVCVVWGLYFLLLPVVRRRDKKCERILRTFRARDNHRSYPYVYVVAVLTGWQTDALTKANVYLTLVGDRGETLSRHICGGIGNGMMRGSASAFILTTEKCLGHLRRATIWHDNSGESPSWYLHALCVCDLQTGALWYFLCNNWLGTDKGDGATIRELAVASPKELTALKNVFPIQTNRGPRNYHLWISIIERPPDSDFTYVQRLSCALLMVLSTMFADISSAELSLRENVGETFDIMAAVSFSFPVSLIVFPLIFIFTVLFQRVQPPPETPVLIQSAAWNQTQSADNTGEKAEFPRYSKSGNSFDTETADDKISLQDSQLSTALILPDTISSDIVTTSISYEVSESPCEDTRKSFHGLPGQNNNNNYSVPNVSQMNVKETTTRLLLPRWSLYVIWLVLFTMSFTFSFLTVLYGLEYGYYRSLQWLVSFLIGMLISVFCVEWLKTMLIIMVVTLILRKPIKLISYRVVSSAVPKLQ